MLLVVTITGSYNEANNNAKAILCLSSVVSHVV